ncbi:E3 ubiquitin-protein ligase XIAP-like [Brevipalpus obovatus]|uniref:E3 ubiquitin-protein ligase XIAP-like n=1 Tax=Brevipalpus obovatus TaxID=246614 RepID=UPI003D9DB59C
MDSPLNTTTTTPLTDNNESARGIDVCGIYTTPRHLYVEQEEWPKIEEDHTRGTLILHYPNGVKKQYIRARIHRGPAFPDYVTCSARLESFRKLSWPKNHHLKPEALADAGFFYRGIGDETHCFYCAAGLREWAKDDDPWVEHAKHLPDCSFLALMKGDDFIQNCRNMKNVQIVQPRTESTAENLPESASNTPPEEVGQQQQQLHQQQQAEQQQQEQQQQQTTNSCERKPDHTRTPNNTNAVQQVSSQESSEDSSSPPSDVEQPENLETSPTSIASPSPSCPESAPASPSPSDEVASTSPSPSPSDEIASTSSSSSDESLDHPITPTTTSSEKFPSDKLEEKSEKTEQSLSPSTPICLKSDENAKSIHNCLICLMKNVKITFIPCGHAVTCVECSHAVSDCIVCRRPIASLVKLHL